MNIISENFEKVFRTRTRGGNNDSSQRFYVMIIFPQHLHVPAATEVEVEKISKIFDVESQVHPCNSTDGNYFYLSFSTRAEFAKFPSIFSYLHARQAFMRLACWDRDFIISNSDGSKSRSDVNPSDAPDDHPVFWAVLAAAQMFYREQL